MVFVAGEDLTSKRLEDEIGVGKRKNADQTVTSSTALVNDTVLTWSVDVFTAYIFDLYLVTTGSNSGNINVGWGVPAGTTMSWCATGLDTALAYKNVANLAAATASSFGTASTSLGRLVHASGYFSVDATSGSFTLRWAQATSNATATTVRAGSMGVLTRV